MGRRKRARKAAEKLQAEATRQRNEILRLKQQLAAGFADLPITGVSGFDPAELAALKGRAIEGTSRRFTDIGARLKTALARRGVLTSGTAPSGDFARTLLRLGTAEETERAGGLRDIAFEDARLRRAREEANRRARIGAAGIFAGDVPALAGLTATGLGVQSQLALTPTFGQQLAGQLIGASAGAATAGVGGASGGGLAPG